MVPTVYSLAYDHLGRVLPIHQQPDGWMIIQHNNRPQHKSKTKQTKSTSARLVDPSKPGKQNNRTMGFFTARWT
jgi:protein subunit release factor A